MNKICILLSLFVFTTLISQEDKIFERIQAINNNSVTFYNIDGYTITGQIFNYQFTEKNLKKVYRKYSIKKDEIKTIDQKLPYSNYCVFNTEKLTEKLTQNNSYYFVENTDKRIAVIQFTCINKEDRGFERKLVKLIVERAIPNENFAVTVIDSINFAGRKIKLGSSCYWTNINTVQCPYNGEMNWSVHKDLEDARNAIAYQLEITKSRKNGKVISEEMVDVVFEETETKAKRVIYDPTGVMSLLVGASGGKTLIIYYVATAVRGNFVSCVLSFWNNDNITKNGLAPLLEEVMRLKE